MNKTTYLVESVYPNDEANTEEFESRDEAFRYYYDERNELLKDNDGYEYVIIKQVDNDYNTVDVLDVARLADHCMNKTIIEQFDSLDDSHFEWIDEVFYHWCNRNDVDYYADDNEYPAEFKEYYIINEHNN